MKKVKIPELIYKNELGEIILKKVAVSLDESDYEKFKNGSKIEDLDYGLYGETIEGAEKQIAKSFFKKMYRPIMNGDISLSSNEISAIQNFLGLNNVEFSLLLGIDKASLTNIYKREKLSRSVCLLIIERLGMELSRKGSAKKIVDHSAPLFNLDREIVHEINEVRFGEEAT
jgi:hypothetical protein